MISSSPVRPLRPFPGFQRSQSFLSARVSTPRRPSFLRLPLRQFPRGSKVATLTAHVLIGIRIWLIPASTFGRRKLPLIDDTVSEATHGKELRISGRRSALPWRETDIDGQIVRDRYLEENLFDDLRADLRHRIDGILLKRRRYRSHPQR